MMTLLSTLSNFLHDSIVICAAIIFLFLIVFIIVNRKVLADFFKSIKPTIWILLLIIFIAAIIVRLNFPGGLYHKLVIDEPWYLEAAKNIATTGQQGNYQKSIGWPMLLAVPFFIFGPSINIALDLSVLLGSLTALLFFFIIKKITNNISLSLLGALMLAVNPVHIFWSTSAETSIPSLFFILITLFFWLFYFKNPDFKLLFLALSSALTASLFRPENIILIPVLLIGTLIFIRKFFLQNWLKILLATLFYSFLATPNTLSFFVFFFNTPYFKGSFSIYGPSGTDISNWSVSQLSYIANWQLAGIFKTPSLALSLFALLGLLVNFTKYKKIILFFIAWFILFFLFYFVSWYPTLSYYYDNFLNESRFYLSFFPIILIFSTFGIEFIIKKIKGLNLKNFLFYSSVLIFAFSLIGIQNFLTFQRMTFLNKDSTTLQENKLLTKIAQEIKNDLPADCTIISSETSVLTSINNIKTIRADQIIADGSVINNFDPQKCLLFFEDKYCLTAQNSKSLRDKKNKCRIILENYNFKPYKSYSLGALAYTFYKLTP